MAEIELNVLTKQCLNRHIDNLKTIKKEVSAWQKHRNKKRKQVVNHMIRVCYDLNAVLNKRIDNGLRSPEILPCWKMKLLPSSGVPAMLSTY